MVSELLTSLAREDLAQPIGIDYRWVCKRVLDGGGGREVRWMHDQPPRRLRRRRGMGDEVFRMKVWTLFVNGELNGIFDSEEKAVEARRQGLARGP